MNPYFPLYSEIERSSHPKVIGSNAAGKGQSLSRARRRPSWRDIDPVFNRTERVAVHSVLGAPNRPPIKGAKLPTNRRRPQEGLGTNSAALKFFDGALRRSSIRSANGG